MSDSHANQRDFDLADIVAADHAGRYDLTSDVRSAMVATLETALLDIEFRQAYVADLKRLCGNRFRYDEPADESLVKRIVADRPAALDDRELTILALNPFMIAQLGNEIDDRFPDTPAWWSTMERVGRDTMNRDGVRMPDCLESPPAAAGGRRETGKPEVLTMRFADHEIPRPPQSPPAGRKPGKPKDRTAPGPTDDEVVTCRIGSVDVRLEVSNGRATVVLTATDGDQLYDLLHGDGIQWSGGSGPSPAGGSTRKEEGRWVYRQELGGLDALQGKTLIVGGREVRTFSQRRS